LFLLIGIILIGCAVSDTPVNDDTTDGYHTEAPVSDSDTEEVTDETEKEPDEDYFENTRVEIVPPDASKVIDAAITDDGYDIYRVYRDAEYGYRYGATYLYNDDNSIDAYFACPGTGGLEEWDWISYRRSEDGGNSWSDEEIVLTPTPGSMDQFSCCDPGVVYFNGYYYRGYTSTINSKGVCNNVFVARSENPDGPFEKWNGHGWGGENPEPIFYYDEYYASFGNGEPSFVELNGTLYIYYSHCAPTGEYTMVATADATDENWPATIKNQGSAVKKTTDSLDIKYIEDWGKFIGISTGERMGPNSWIAVYESNNGLDFELVDVVREGTYTHLHNAGVSSRRNGHINLSEDADKLCVIYAYGEGWGIWNTRVQPISLTLSEGNDMAAEKAKGCETYFAYSQPVSITERGILMFQVEKDLFYCPMPLRTFIPVLYVADTYQQKRELPRKTEGVTFKVYDESVCTVNPETWKFKLVSPGFTAVEVRYKNFVDIFYVTVTETPIKDTTEGNGELVPVNDSVMIYIGEQQQYRPQLRARATNEEGPFNEYFTSDVDRALTFTDYDSSIISVSDRGEVTALAVGETYVTLTLDGMSCKIKVTVSDNPEDGFFLNNQQ